MVAREPHPYVSRGGVKLAAALDAFALDPAGLVCLDIGASTGGFTDVLLARGAEKVFAVDVGHGQLDGKLAADPRVVSMEGTDARAVTIERLGGRPQAIVCDVSFISQRLIWPSILPLAARPAWLVGLIKPQFELTRAHLVKGRVRDEAGLDEAKDAVRAAIEAMGWTVLRNHALANRRRRRRKGIPHRRAQRMSRERRGGQRRARAPADRPGASTASALLACRKKSRSDPRRLVVESRTRSFSIE